MVSRPLPAEAPAPLEVPVCVVISGGAAGAFYVRQLLRAAAAGRLRVERIVVVDRERECAAAAFRGPGVELATAAWDEWLDANLGALGERDQLVPYHWAPHVLVGWLRREAGRAGLRLEREGTLPARGLPFERDTSEGDRALSYASWPCPPSCIEPALCPHTRGPRNWSLAGDLAQAPAGCDAAIVLRSLHLVYGVAAIPVREIHAARDLLLSSGSGRRRFVIATASHCHGLAGTLVSSPAWTLKT